LINDRKKLEEERAHLLALLKSDLEQGRSERRLRDIFVSTLSHDLRTPLSAIKSSAELILKHSVDIQRSDHILRTIVNSVNRADKMIQDLLDANRLRAGQKLPLQVDYCDLVELATNTLQELPLIHGDRFRLNRTDPISGYWDCGGLRRVFENLVNNAVKYGSPLTPITVTLEGGESMIRIMFHNEGKEIPHHEQATLFDQFRRVVDFKVGRKEGLGVGLTIVRGITEAHGGHVYVASEPNRGTTFTIELPKDARYFQVAA
jgi:signal transduction histidine kinase